MAAIQLFVDEAYICLRNVNLEVKTWRGTCQQRKKTPEPRHVGRTLSVETRDLPDTLLAVLMMDSPYRAVHPGHFRHELVGCQDFTGLCPTRIRL